MRVPSEAIELADRKVLNDEVAPVLRALKDARIRYAVWGSAACCYHGGRWLWKSQDYEIFIDDWHDGPKLRLAVDVITVRCAAAWEHDQAFDQVAWAQSRGDARPPRLCRRFKHLSHESILGVVLVPAAQLNSVSMHRDDLVSDETEPVWIYPSLKNYVEGQLGLWNFQARNSSLLDLADLVSARRLTQGWADAVGLNVAKEKESGKSHLPSEWEMWSEIARMSLSSSDWQRASARFAARRAEKDARRQAEEAEAESADAQS